MSGTSRPTSTFSGAGESNGSQEGLDGEDASNVGFWARKFCCNNHSYAQSWLKTNISTSLFYRWKHLEIITLSHPQGMLELLQTGELADVDVMVGGRVFRCHKAILGARYEIPTIWSAPPVISQREAEYWNCINFRSPVLKAAFVHNMMEKATGKINIDGIESNTVRLLSCTETPISI